MEHRRHSPTARLPGALLLAAVLLPAIAPHATADQDTRARPSPRSLSGLPYEVVDDQSRPLPRFEDGRRGHAVTLADTDGDGFAELVHCWHEGILLRRHDGIAARTVDQFNLPPAYTVGRPFASLLAHDADGDGRQEVVAVTRHRDRSHWRLWLLDLEAQEIRGDVTLPVFPERRADGRWDGGYVPVASLPVAGRPRPLVLMVCVVGHDVHGRGLLAVDPVAGEVVWRRHLDGAPMHTRTPVADLDGDGRPEIATLTQATDNLEGVRLHGVSDDSLRVHVLTDTGEILWRRSLAGPGSGGSLVAVDLDGEPGRELVTVCVDNATREGHVAVWSGDGRRLWSRRDPRRQSTLVAAAAGAPGAPATVVVSNARRSLEALRWHDGELTVVAERSTRPKHPTPLALDVLPDLPGEELVLLDGQQARVAGRDLRPLAGIRLDGDHGQKSAFVWHAGPGTRPLLLPGRPLGMLSLQPAPAALHPAWFAGGTAVLLGTAGLWWRRRRSHPDHRGVETDPVIRRELRLQLLARLAKGGHEKIGALQALRRLVWRLEAEVTQAAARQHAGADAATAPAANPRLQRSLQTLREETLPRLREILVLGRRTAAPPHLLATGAEILDELAALATAPGNDLTALHTRAATLAREAEAALQRLRRAVESHFRADLAAGTARVLAAQQEEIARRRVTVVTPEAARPAAAPEAPADAAAPAGGPRVAVDPQDLEFVLDNLVGNALRAMAGAPQRRLTIAWQTAGPWVIATVDDTGVGIAPEDHEAIFEEGFSDRPGGGYGLSRSRRDLALYGATLRVRESRAGEGTTFELVLPLAEEDPAAPPADRA